VLCEVSYAEEDICLLRTSALRKCFIAVFEGNEKNASIKSLLDFLEIQF
jgi:hypothetical protein